MTTETAESYFRRNGITYKRNSSGAYGVNLEFSCPMCGSEGDKKKKASINNATWLWKCHSGSCDAKGNELTLKRIRKDIYDVRGPSGDDLEKLKNDEFIAAMKARASTSNDVERWAYDLWHNDGAQHARDYLAGRGISRATAELAWVGWSHAWPGKEPMHEFGLMMLPALTEPGNSASCAMVKIRTLNPDVPKSDRYRRLAGGESILYAPCGMKVDEPLLLVGGEIDTLSIIQAGYTNVCSSTTGEDGWSDIYTKQVAEIEDLVIVYDNDVAGEQGAAKIVETLGVHRCRVGKWPGDPKEINDANDLLKRDLDEFDLFAVMAIIAAAAVPKLAGIIDLSSLRSRIHAFISGDWAGGWPTGWDDLDQQIGGWGRAENTYITGDTGCGKTSYASQAALYQAEHVKHGVLFCPLEVGPVKQMLKWVRQRSRLSPKGMERSILDGWITNVCDLPLHIFHTREKGNVEAWRNTLMYAYSRLGVRFVVIDHIHAAVNPGKGERVELVMMAQMFHEVSIDTGMHIVILAHPHSLKATNTKDRDNAIVQMSDIKGSSDLKQYADNVHSIWRPRKAGRDKIINKQTGYGTSVVYLLKVRDEDGQEGRVPFRYHVQGALLLDDVETTADGLRLFKTTPEPESDRNKNWQDTH